MGKQSRKRRGTKCNRIVDALLNEHKAAVEKMLGGLLLGGLLFGDQRDCVCPECGSDDHTTKTHKWTENPAGCNSCGWRGVGGQLVYKKLVPVDVEWNSKETNG